MTASDVRAEAGAYGQEPRARSCRCRLDKNPASTRLRAMKTRILLVSAVVLATSLACGGMGGGGGLSSAACVEYFEVVETCSAKAEAKGTPAGKALAEAWREAAKLSRAEFEKNPNAVAVEMSCQATTPTIRDNPECQ